MSLRTLWLKSLSGRLLAALVVGVVVLDQLTKYLSNTQLTYNQPLTVVPGFDLLLVYNTGAAFSFLSDMGGWQRWILAGISLLVSLGIGVWLWRLPRQQVLLSLALALVLGGALGNLYDRIVLGHVIDFISVYFRDWRFATFNVADAAISIGAALLALDVFVNGEQHETTARS
jgi:signal peptidase II